jgi:hypothetical protein
LDVLKKNVPIPPQHLLLSQVAADVIDQMVGHYALLVT